MLESSFDDEYKRRKSNTDKTKSSKTSSKHSTNPTEESKLSSEKSSKPPPLSQESESASNQLDETIEEPLPFKRYHGFAFANPRSGDGLAGRFLNDYPPKNIK